MLRKGFIYRLYDYGPLTISFCGSYFANGSHRWPMVSMIFRDRWLAGPSCTGGKALKARRISLPLPYLPWRHAYKLRKFGALRVTKGFDKLYRRLFYLGYSR